jgi:hypothetical protein
VVHGDPSLGSHRSCSRPECRRSTVDAGWIVQPDPLRRKLPTTLHRGEGFRTGRTAQIQVASTSRPARVGPNGNLIFSGANIVYRPRASDARCETTRSSCADSAPVLPMCSRGHRPHRTAPSGVDYREPPTRPSVPLRRARDAETNRPPKRSVRPPEPRQRRTA